MKVFLKSTFMNPQHRSRYMFWIYESNNRKGIILKSMLFSFLVLTISSSLVQAAIYTCERGAWANSLAGGYGYACAAASSDATECVVDQCVMSGKSEVKCQEKVNVRIVEQNSSPGYYECTVRAKIRI